MWFSFTVIKRNLWSPTDNNQSCTGEMKCHMVSGELTYGCSSHVRTIQGTGKVERNISNMLTLLIISYCANTASAGGASSFRERPRKKGSRSLESIFFTCFLSFNDLQWSVVADLWSLQSSAPGSLPSRWPATGSKSLDLHLPHRRWESTCETESWREKKSTSVFVDYQKK